MSFILYDRREHLDNVQVHVSVAPLSPILYFQILKISPIEVQRSGERSKVLGFFI